jgi:hypothetical protein
MPHLHLPADHSDADIVLAANVAATVGSEDLYVAWTHDSGAGAVPEIEAVVRESRPSAVAWLARGVANCARALWHGLTQPAAPARAAAPAAAAPARETYS